MKRSTFKIALVSVLLLVPFLLAGNALAVDSLQGRGSLGLSLTIQHTEIDYSGDTGEADTRFIIGSLGYFVTDNIEINFAPTVIYIEAEGEEVTMYSYFGNVKYNFFSSGQTAVPYLGLQAGISGAEYGGDSDSNFAYGGMAGVKFFLTEDLSFDAEVNYLKTEFDVDDTTVDMDNLGLFLGFKYYFGD